MNHSAVSEIAVLHTAVRRYCMQQSQKLRDRYFSSGMSSDRSESGAFLQRGHALVAMLAEVERVTPDEFGSIKETKDYFALVGQAAENGWTRMRSAQTGAIAAAIAEERADFVQFIRDFNAATIEAAFLEPLPYRRVLKEQECKAIWERMELSWGADGTYWYPLRSLDSIGLPSEVAAAIVAFRADEFDVFFGEEILRELLRAMGISRLYRLLEGGGGEPQYEVDLILFKPNYCGLEVYSTPESLSWLIYASHENSITFAGEPLVSALKSAWPEWEQCLYVEGELFGRRPEPDQDG